MIYADTPLIFQITTLPELAPFKLSPGGCQGIIGPVPPPFWISAPLGAVQLLAIYNTLWWVLQG